MAERGIDPPVLAAKASPPQLRAEGTLLEKLGLGIYDAPVLELRARVRSRQGQGRLKGLLSLLRRRLLEARGTCSTPALRCSRRLRRWTSSVGAYLTSEG